jgi:hypothetical protein
MTWKRGWPTTFQEDGCAENSRRKMEQTQFSRSEIIPVDNSYSIDELKAQTTLSIIGKISALWGVSEHHKKSWYVRLTSSYVDV